MDNREAIYCLKAESERYSEVCEECSLYGEVGCDHCYDDATDIAIEAIEKQIPQSPLNKQGNPLWGYCPNCGDVVTRYGSPVGCKNCLQKLDWSRT